MAYCLGNMKEEHRDQHEFMLYHKTVKFQYFFITIKMSQLPGEYGSSSVPIAWLSVIEDATNILNKLF